MGEEKPRQYIIDDDYLLDDHLQQSVQKRRKDRKTASKPKKKYTNVHEF